MDAYDILGVPVDATADEIRHAYQLLARQHHPDRRVPRDGLPDSILHESDVNETFCKIQDAWEQLRDPNVRRCYDVQRLADLSRDACLDGRALEVDLGDMDYTEDEEGNGLWRYRCRCGDTFEITEKQLAASIHAVACRSCSLVLVPLYQAVADVGNDHVDVVQREIISEKDKEL